MKRSSTARRSSLTCVTRGWPRCHRPPASSSIATTTSMPSKSWEATELAAPKALTCAPRDVERYRRSVSGRCHASSGCGGCCCQAAVRGREASRLPLKVLALPSCISSFRIGEECRWKG